MIIITSPSDALPERHVLYFPMETNEQLSIRILSFSKLKAQWNFKACSILFNLGLTQNILLKMSYSMSVQKDEWKHKLAQHNNKLSMCV